MSQFNGIMFTDCTDVRGKICAVCNNKFKPRSGVQKYCSAACKAVQHQARGANSVDLQYSRISGNWNRYFSRLIGKTSRRSTLTRDQLVELLHRQGGKCALSGIELTCKLERGVKCETNASIDRLDPGGAYVLENIQLVCSVLNSWRSNTKLGSFVDWCKRVANHAQQKERL